MKFRQILLIPVLALTFTGLSAQPKSSLAHKLYSVNRQIDVQLKKNPWADTGTLKNSMTIKVFRNSNLFFNQTLDCYTKSYLVKDTIYITGYMPGGLGWGFRLILIKDSCIASSFALSDGKIYKHNKTDADSTNFILLQNVSQKIILSKRPGFQNDEIVAGLIELKSLPYYYTNLDGKFSIDLKTYFKTAALQQQQ